MALTPGGSPYVESSDLVANYPAVSLAVANKIDTKSNLDSPTFSNGINLNATTSYAPQMIVTNAANDDSSAYIITQKSRAGGIVVNQDALINMLFRGHDGVGFQNAAALVVTVDTTPGANDMPGRMAFFTTPDGSTTINERLRISQDGSITGSGSLGAWTAFTPTVDATQFTIGNGTITSRYCKLGKIVLYTGALTYGSTTVYGNTATDTIRISTPTNIQLGVSLTTGTGQYIDSSLGRSYPVFMSPSAAAQLAFTFGITNVTANTLTSSGFNNNVPVAEGTGDTVHWTYIYEEA